jgi:predicted trehalose synthase
MRAIEIRSIGRLCAHAADGREVIVLVMQTFSIDADGWKHAVPGTRRYCTLSGDDVTLNADGTFELFDKWSGRSVTLRPTRRSARV